MEKINQVKFLFNKLKQGHTYWVAGDSGFKERLETALGGTIDELERLGVARHFSEALLFWGKEFVDSAVVSSKDRLEASVADAEAIFGVEAVDMSDRERRASEIAKKHGVTSYIILEGESLKIKSLDPRKPK